MSDSSTPPPTAGPHRSNDEPHSLYPVALTDLAGAPVVVVGGGRVAERKLKTLVNAGAVIRLVSPDATPALQRLAQSGAILWLPRGYVAGDLTGARLAVAATDQREVNAQVAREAAAADILCNVADRPEEGNIHLPAVLRIDGLVIAVSTEAGDPVRAKAVRDAIGDWLRPAEPDP